MNKEQKIAAGEKQTVSLDLDPDQFGDNPISYLTLPAPPDAIPIASSRLVAEFGRPYLTIVYEDDEAFKKVLAGCHRFYYALNPDLPLAGQPADVQQAAADISTAIGISTEDFFADLEARQKEFESCARNRSASCSWKGNYGFRLIPKGPACVSKPDIPSLYNPADPLELPLHTPEDSCLLREAHSALIDLEEYWDLEHDRLNAEDEDGELSELFEEEFGRSYDPDDEIPYPIGEFDFERWDQRVEQARKTNIERFFDWSKGAGIEKLGFKPEDLVRAQMVFDHLFSYCYLGETGEMLKISELSRDDLRIFIFEHLFCSVFQLPAEYFQWIPLLRIYFKFLQSCGYLPIGDQFDSMLRSIEPELTQYLLRQFG